MRRFLRYQGPSTAARFADWAGVSSTFARGSWALVAGAVEPVSFEGRTLWLSAGDLEALHGAAPPRGVRLLPPHDPYLAPQDKALLLPERAAQRVVWRTAGNPGGILVGGEIAGVWHPHKQGDKLTLRVEAFRALDERALQMIAREAEVVGRLRQVVTVRVAF